MVYLAAGFDSAYYLYSYPYERLILARAIRSVAATPFPISVDAPMCVHATYMRQSNPTGERLIVHLYNDLNSTGGHAKPDDDVPLREEIVPIHDIRVSFTNPGITRVHLEPEGLNLPIHRTRDHVEVVVPKLSIHSMVVAELSSNVTSR